ncbi:hypothetical protein ACFL10_02380 [Patescibacteria group bacterium]
MTTNLNEEDGRRIIKVVIIVMAVIGYLNAIALGIAMGIKTNWAAGLLVFYLLFVCFLGLVSVLSLPLIIERLVKEKEETEQNGT